MVRLGDAVTASPEGEMFIPGDEHFFCSLSGFFLDMGITEAVLFSHYIMQGDAEMDRVLITTRIVWPK